MASENKKSGGTSTLKIVLIIVGSLIGLFCITIILGLVIAASSLGGGDLPAGNGNIAVIPLVGPIYSEGISSTLSPASASAEKIVQFIEQADKASNIKAIVIDINSPGGTPVASDMITKALKSAKKPTYALIRDVGASGGYMVASAADEIIAYRMSITGSIGVIGSYLEFSGLMDKYGVGYERLVAGQYKDSGSPFRSLTEKERQIWQTQLDALHEIFIEEVAKNREMTIESVRELADGRVFVGDQALKLGLIDHTGGEVRLKEMLKELLGEEPKYSVYKRQASLIDMLGGYSTKSMQSIGEGIGSTLTEQNNYPNIII